VGGRRSMSADNNSAKPMEPATPKIGKKGSGRFKKGISGNSTGRPKGSRNKTTMMAQALFDEEADKIVRKVIELGLQEDFWPALKASLDRILPPVKSTPLAFEMPPLQTLDDLVGCYREVIDAFSRGDLTADDSRMMHDLLDGTRRAMAASDLAERVIALENLMGGIK